eukprot:Nk52_evm72s215 gene=Nk52_evmTU72s215
MGERETVWREIADVLQEIKEGRGNTEAYKGAIESLLNGVSRRTRGIDEADGVLEVIELGDWFILNGDVSLGAVGLKVLNACSEACPALILKKFSKEHIINTLERKGMSKRNLLYFVFCSLSVKQKAKLDRKVLLTEAASVYEKIVAMRWDLSTSVFSVTDQILLCKLLISFPWRGSSSFSCKDMIVLIVGWALAYRPENMQFARMYCETLSAAILSFRDLVDTGDILVYIFCCLGTSKNTSILFCAYLMLTFCKELSGSISSSSLCSVIVEKVEDDESIICFVGRIQEILALPEMDEFVIGLVSSLASSSRNAVFSSVTGTLLEGCLKELNFLPRRLQCLNIVRAILLGDQRSSSNFHKSLPYFKILFEKLDGGDSNELLVKRAVVQLIYTLAYKFNANADQLAVVSPFMTGENPPSENVVHKLLTEKRFEFGSSSSALITQSSSYENLPKYFPHVAGLKNSGCNCYANSILQILYHSQRFCKTLGINLGVGNSVKLRQGEACCSVGVFKLFSFLNLTDRHAIIPDEFLKENRPGWFEEGEQQDSSEYLKYIFATVEEECKRIDSSCPCDIFKGKNAVLYECKSCGNVVTSEEDFYDMPLHFDESKRSNGSHLSAMLKASFEDEEVSNFFCEQCCTKSRAIRRNTIKYAPECLVITLNRFGYDSVLKKRYKVQDTVVPDRRISVPIAGQGDASYQVYALNVHAGASARFGHYFSIVQNLMSTEREWILFNDERVSVCKGPGHHLHGTESLYMVFYVRSDVEAREETFGANNIFSKSPFYSKIMRDNEKFQAEFKNRPGSSTNAAGKRRFEKDNDRDSDGGASDTYVPHFVS